jgi:hypothetical protein
MQREQSLANCYFYLLAATVFLGEACSSCAINKAAEKAQGERDQLRGGEQTSELTKKEAEAQKHAAEAKQKWAKAQDKTKQKKKELQQAQQEEQKAHAAVDQTQATTDALK